MKAFQVSAPGAEPGWSDTAVPMPGPGQVQVRIAACGLNFADLLMAAGTYQDMPGYPLTLGMELSGTVTDTGGNVSPDLTPGTRVAVFGGSGGLAEYGVFPADRCLILPDAMPFDVAAGFQIAYATSHLALTRRARLQPGETLLVLGAAGGVGLTAVEIGHRTGARVIAMARGADRLAAARAAGADQVIDGTSADLRTAVMALGGADVVYDPVGGDAFRAAIRCLRPEGRYLSIGFASGDVPEVRPNHLLVKNVDLIGFYLGGYLAFRPDVLADSLRTLCGWYVKGQLDPQISHRFPAGQAAEALGLLKNRGATGKIVVTL